MKKDCRSVLIKSGQLIGCWEGV